MKINGMNRMNGINPYQKLNPQPMEKTKKTVAKDEVNISPEALELMKSSKAENAERNERVQRLKEQVQSGNYRVDTQKLAEKMYDELKKQW